MMPLVFVVDGVAERRCVAQYALEQAGYSVETFATTHALEAAEQQLPSFIVVAIKLPDASGVEFCRRIRAHSVLSETAVILIADNKMDKQIAEVRAKEVPNVFIVDNKLVVANQQAR